MNFSCFFGRHDHRFRSRDENGHLLLVCSDCGHQQRILTTAIVQGPKAQQAKVPGQPLIVAVSDKVTPLKRRTG